MREAEIKRALAQHLDGAHGSTSTMLLEELKLSNGEIRADVVDVSDLHCYEIKSEGDSLKRLLGQGSRYARVFDHVTLVTTERHLKKALPILPEWWGILLVPESEDSAFKQFRVAKPNKRQEAEVLVTLLKRDECLHVLETIGFVKGLKSRNLHDLQARLAELMGLDELKEAVRQCLYRRGGSLPDAPRDLFSIAF